jgi:hypothetical protein
VKLDCGDVFGTPVRRTKLYVVVSVPGIPYVRKM